MAMLAGAGLYIVGCDPKNTEDLTRDTAHIAQDASAAMASATQAGKVRAVLSLRKGVELSGISIDAKDGVVTLSGTVRDHAEHRRIVDTVNQIRGVDKVEDKLGEPK